MIFSPGLAFTHLIYSDLITNIASKGYILVALDHPYDDNILEFPDGTVVYGIFPEENDAIPAEGHLGALSSIAARTADISFVLNQLLIASIAHSLIPGLHPITALTPKK
jgi:hypothetical protein